MARKKNYVRRGKDGVVRYIENVPVGKNKIGKAKKGGKPFYEDTGCVVAILTMGAAALRTPGKI